MNLVTHLIIFTTLPTALDLSAGLAQALEIVEVEALPVVEVSLGAIGVEYMQVRVVVSAKDAVTKRGFSILSPTLLHPATNFPISSISHSPSPSFTFHIFVN